jgi:hypothetical protein
MRHVVAIACRPKPHRREPAYGSSQVRGADVSNSRRRGWWSKFQSAQGHGGRQFERVPSRSQSHIGRWLCANSLQAFDRTDVGRTLAVHVAAGAVLAPDCLHTFAIFHHRRGIADNRCPGRRHGEADDDQNSNDEAPEAHGVRAFPSHQSCRPRLNKQCTTSWGLNWRRRARLRRRNSLNKGWRSLQSCVSARHGSAHLLHCVTRFRMPRRDRVPADAAAHPRLVV